MGKNKNLYLSLFVAILLQACSNEEEKLSVGPFMPEGAIETSNLIQTYVISDGTYVESDEVELTVVYYDKPLHVVSNRLVDVDTLPYWWDAFICTSSYAQLGYERFAALLSPEFIEATNLAKESFEDNVSDKETVEAVQLKGASILSTYNLKSEGREFMIVRYYEYALLDEYKESLELKTSTFFNLLERIDGVWKHQIPYISESVGAYATMNRAVVEEIIEDGKLIFKTENIIIPFD